MARKSANARGAPGADVLAKDLMDVDAVAAWAGVKPASWRRMVSRGDAPAPVLHIGRSPAWTLEVLRDWRAQRPGAGRPKGS